MSKREPFVIVPRWLLGDVAEGRVVPGAMATFLAIAQHGRAGTGTGIFVSQTTLASETHVEEKTVRRHIRQLVEVGAVTTTKRYVKGRRTTDSYVVATKGRLYRTSGPGSAEDPNGASCPPYAGHEAPSNQTPLIQTAAALSTEGTEQQHEHTQEDAMRDEPVPPSRQRVQSYANYGWEPTA